MPVIIALIFFYGLWNLARDVASAPKSGRHGMSDFLDEAWHGFWEQRARALAAARNAKDLNGDGRVSWKERWAAAKVELAAGARQTGADARRVAGWVANSPLVRPVGEPRPAAAAAVDPQPEPGDTPTPEPTPAPIAPDQPQATPAATNGGTPVTAPTGEAVNYETTVNELEGIAKEQQGQIDSAKQALDAASSMKSAIDGMQQSYNATSAAAHSVNDHLQAMNLDGETLGHVGTVGDAMPAGAVDAMYDQIEEIEAAAKEQLANAEIALASTEAALSTVVGKYGDANATVQGELGGDASFLHGAGIAGAGATAAPMAAPAGRHAAPVA